MKFVNGWKSTNKQVDKFQVCLRFGWFTLFEFDFDIIDCKLRIGVFNLFMHYDT